MEHPSNFSRGPIDLASALIAALLLSAPLAAQQIIELRISGPASPSEHSAASFLVLPFDRPIVNNADGYSPTTTADSGGTLPSQWTQPVKLTWNFGDGEKAVIRERVSVSHQYKQGSYTLTVSAEDENGVFGVGTRTVEVRNGDPQFLWIAASPSPEKNAVMTFSARAFDNPEDKLTYQWDFGDGETEEGEDLWEVRHQYVVGGRYEVTLKVLDEDGGEAETTKRVLVADATASATTQTGAEDVDASQTVATEFRANVSGALATTFNAEIHSLAGVHLQSIRPGVCRFMFTVWDPSALAFGLFVLDLRNLDHEGSKYIFSRPTASWEFYSEGAHYALRKRGLLPLGAKGLGGLTQSLADLGPVAGTSPFGFETSVRFGWGSGSLEMTFMPGRFVTGKLSALFNSSEQGPLEGRPITINGKFSIDLEAARREGMVNYDGCAGEPLEIERQWPKDKTQHVDYRKPRIKLRFNQDIDPTTVTNSTFEVGFTDTSGELLTITGRLLKDDDTVVFVPASSLRSGVRYTARVRTGDEGVRSKSGSKLEETDGNGWQSWRFTTSIDFQTDGDASKLLACHMYQTARDVPLIVDKPAIARVYANWKQHLDVHPDAQVKEFNARVVLRHSDWSELANTHYRFVRPDLWQSRGIDTAAAEHTAQVTNFEPFAGMLPSTRFSLQVRQEPGKDLKNVYSGRCPSVLWDKSPRLKVDVFFLKIGELGTDEELLATVTPVVRDLVSKARTYAWQMFPLQEIEFSVPRFVDPPTTPTQLSSCDPLCWLEGDGVDWPGLGEWLRTQSSADVIALIGPHEILGGGGYASVRLPEGQGLLASSIGLNPAYFGRYVNALVHEMGHVLGIEHIPTVTYTERSRVAALRNGSADLLFKGIEGFRMSRDGSVGWNKSFEEGNEEAKWLTPLMFPGTIDQDSAFIANHQYRKIQKMFDQK